MSRDISQGRPCKEESRSVMSLFSLHTNILMKMMIMKRKYINKINTDDIDMNSRVLPGWHIILMIMMIIMLRKTLPGWHIILKTSGEVLQYWLHCVSWLLSENIMPSIINHKGGLTWIQLSWYWWFHCQEVFSGNPKLLGDPKVLMKDSYLVTRRYFWRDLESEGKTACAASYGESACFRPPLCSCLILRMCVNDSSAAVSNLARRFRTFRSYSSSS